MCLIACILIPALPSVAQVLTEWSLIVDGEASDWRPSQEYSPLESDQAASDALLHLQEEGYFLARIDSVVTGGDTYELLATRGPVSRVGDIAISGVASYEQVFDADLLRTRPEQAFRKDELNDDINYILTSYERAGFPLVQLNPTVEFRGLDDGDPIVNVQFQIVPGERLRLVGFELDGGRRTSSAFAARVTELQLGELLPTYDPAKIQRDLEATNLFEEVGQPAIALTDSGAVIRMSVEEAPPGKFDLILGYLPASGSRDGSVVGNGLLELTNLFGGGRQIRLRLVRNPGLVSSVDAQISDPYIFGLPFRATVRFQGLNQDSTFSRQQYSVEGGYRLVQGLELIVTGSNESVEPGPFGSELVDGRPRVAESSAVFAGAGVRYTNVDQPLNPRSGLLVEAIVEQGFRRRSLPDSTDGTVYEATNLQQQRMEVRSRLFLPTWTRQALVVGVDGHLLISGRAAGDDENARYDQGDLFRFGGATSLRGYDEDQFLGSIVGRVFSEYRYQLDRTSYAFIFADVGYVDRPMLADFEAEKETLPGYGFGLQYATPLGLVTVTYALNPDLGVEQGKVHAGLSFGL